MKTKHATFFSAFWRDLHLVHMNLSSSSSDSSEVNDFRHDSRVIGAAPGLGMSRLKKWYNNDHNHKSKMMRYKQNENFLPKVETKLKSCGWKATRLASDIRTELKIKIKLVKIIFLILRFSGFNSMTSWTNEHLSTKYSVYCTFTRRWRSESPGGMTFRYWG